ncbi:hypothetical protein KJ596_02660 [Patescibacteria group bacterium]|nr:hypothetical protein [Patescibacteria group bacterium]MBU1868693.1 hypothetical protein [Patescibacteria group bacterium]
MASMVVFEQAGVLDKGLLEAVEADLFNWGVGDRAEMAQAMRIVREHIVDCQTAVTVHMDSVAPEGEHHKVEHIADYVVVYYMVGGDLYFQVQPFDDNRWPEDDDDPIIED